MGDGLSGRKPRAGKSKWVREGPSCLSNPLTNPFGCVHTQCCGGAGEEPCGPLNWLPGNGGANFAKCDTATGGQQSPINFDINEEGYGAMGKGGGLVLEGGMCAGKTAVKDGAWEVDFSGCGEGFHVTAKGACVHVCVHACMRLAAVDSHEPMLCNYNVRYWFCLNHRQEVEALDGGWNSRRAVRVSLPVVIAPRVGGPTN